MEKEALPHVMPYVLKEEFENGIGLYREIFKAAKEKKIKPDHIQAAIEYLSQLLGNVEERNPRSILVFYPELYSNQEYLIHHAVNTAILALLFYARLKKPHQETIEVSLAALLHDIGHALSNPDLINSPKVLTTEEKLPLTNHPHLGYELLKSLKLPDVVLQGILFHHEKFDETGYPTMLPASRIPDSAKTVALVDLYDNIASDRPYSKGKSPQETLRIMLSLSGSYFSPEQVARFVRIMWQPLCGSKPFLLPGMIVRTNFGEVAKVTHIFEDHILKPDIEILIDRKNKLLQKPLPIKMKNDLERTLTKIYDEDHSKVILEKIQEKLQSVQEPEFKIELITKDEKKS
ncbi:MAG: HD domain-containing protein [Candidatus Hydrogenedentota bacterium]|nr:MAG: HD domain-containing protein [Candidatus Hydrogenedentota bacterium]